VGQLAELNQTYEKWIGFVSGLKGKIVDVSGCYDRMTHDDLESLRFLYMRRQAWFEVYKDKARPERGSINNVSFREREADWRWRHNDITEQYLVEETAWL
jgi:hypothetical protein